MNKFNIVNNSILSKLTDVIRIIFNQEDLVDCININLKNDKEFMITYIKTNIKSLLYIC